MAHDQRGSRVGCGEPLAKSGEAHSISSTASTRLAIGRNEGAGRSAAGDGATSGAVLPTRVGCMPRLLQLKRRIRALGIGAGIGRQLLWATA
jgi:hypothetical protein